MPWWGWLMTVGSVGVLVAALVLWCDYVARTFAPPQWAIDEHRRRTNKP